MRSVRLWQLMLLVAAEGVLVAAYRLDDGCTGLFAVVAAAYVCAGVAVLGGRGTGRGVRKRLLLGLCLGPIGVVLALSNMAPNRWPGSNGATRT